MFTKIPLFSTNSLVYFITSLKIHLHYNQVDFRFFSLASNCVVFNQLQAFFTMKANVGTDPFCSRSSSVFPTIIPTKMSRKGLAKKKIVLELKKHSPPPPPPPPYTQKPLGRQLGNFHILRNWTFKLKKNKKTNKTTKKFPCWSFPVLEGEEVGHTR